MPASEKTIKSGRAAAFGLLLAASFPVLVVFVVTCIEPFRAASLLGRLFEWPFLNALGRSAILAAAVCLLSFFVGWGLGVTCRLLPRQMMGIFIAWIAAPLAIPSFLWAIGISSLRSQVAYRHQSWFDGFSGTVLALAASTSGLVALVTCAAAFRATASQIDAARLHGGEWCVLRCLLLFTAPAAFAAAVFAGSMVVSDTGCSQLMGYHGLASEILISLGARSDLRWATLQSFATGAVSLPLIVAAAFALKRAHYWTEVPYGAARISNGPASPVSGAAALTVCAVVLPILCLPLLGIVMPLFQSYSGWALVNAFSLWESSLPATVGCGLTAAAVAVSCAIALCAWVGSSRRHYEIVVAWSLLILGLPSSLHALGIVIGGSFSSGVVQAALRSDWMAGTTLGFRLLPIAFVTIAPAWLRLPPSYRDASDIFGVRHFRYVCLIAMPILAPGVVLAAGVTFLLCISDVSSLMLLQPPGWVTYPSHVFGMMDNASETKLAALGAVYLLFPALGLAAIAVLSLLRHLAGRVQRASNF